MGVVPGSPEITFMHLPAEERSGHLYARPTERTRGQPVQLLVGHCDTVWPLGTLQDIRVQMKAHGTVDVKRMR